VIASNALLDGTCGLRDLWLLSSITVSPFSSRTSVVPVPKLILLGALPLVGDLLREVWLPAIGRSVGVDGCPLALALGLPRAMLVCTPLLVATDSPGVGVAPKKV
jgi:hypothetical protein